MNNSNRRFFFPQDWYPVLNLSKNTTSNKHYNISDIDETSIDAKMQQSSHTKVLIIKQ